MKINNFRGDLADNSAKKEALGHTATNVNMVVCSAGELILCHMTDNNLNARLEMVRRFSIIGHEHHYLLRTFSPLAIEIDNELLNNTFNKLLPQTFPLTKIQINCM